MNVRSHVSHWCDIRDHMEAESSLANLFSGQITRLTRQMSGRFLMITVLHVYYILCHAVTDGQLSKLKKSGRGGRCGLHHPGTKRHVALTDWVGLKLGTRGSSMKTLHIVSRVLWDQIFRTIDCRWTRGSACPRSVGRWRCSCPTRRYAPRWTPTSSGTSSARTAPRWSTRRTTYSWRIFRSGIKVQKVGRGWFR